MKRNKFSLSNYKLFTGNMGQLLPCGMINVHPGDTVQLASKALIRFSPMLAPVMHPVHAKIHHWFVPYRLLWENFEDFITGGSYNSLPPEMPTMGAGRYGPGNTIPVSSLADYLGIPTGTYDASMEFNALAFRAYALIYNEWYRDQDLNQSGTPLVLTDGYDSGTNVNILNSAWEKDYFTTLRPWAQKGPDLTLPFSQTAPVVTNNMPITVNTSPGNDRTLIEGAASSVNYSGISGTGTNTFKFGADSGLEVDLANAPGSILELRELFALQRYAEARARYGSRYTEYLAYLGVKSSDARLQRPEYLGGGKQTVQFSEVLQTAEGTDPVGSLKGHGIGGLGSNRFRRHFEEHGIVLSLFTMRPVPMYTEGLERFWNYRTKEDFYQQELAHIGQQEVPNKEIFANSTNPEDLFGFGDRYAEYRGKFNTIAGEFRTSALNFWHMARSFGSQPVLNNSFVTSNPTNRIFADTSIHEFQVMCHHSVQARRLITPKTRSNVF